MEQLPLNFEEEKKEKENGEPNAIKPADKKAPQAERPYKSEEEKLAEIRARNKGKPTKIIEDPFLR